MSSRDRAENLAALHYVRSPRLRRAAAARSIGSSRPRALASAQPLTAARSPRARRSVGRLPTATTARADGATTRHRRAWEREAAALLHEMVDELIANSSFTAVVEQRMLQVLDVARHQTQGPRL